MFWVLRILYVFRLNTHSHWVELVDKKPGRCRLEDVGIRLVPIPWTYWRWHSFQPLMECWLKWMYWLPVAAVNFCSFYNHDSVDNDPFACKERSWWDRSLSTETMNLAEWVTHNESCFQSFNTSHLGLFKRKQVIELYIHMYRKSITPEYGKR